MGRGGAAIIINKYSGTGQMGRGGTAVINKAPPRLAEAACNRDAVLLALTKTAGQ